MHPDPSATPPRASQNPGQIGLTKQQLRADVWERRAQRRDHAEADTLRTAHLLSLAADHSTVGCFASVGDEPDTRGVLASLWDRGLAVLLPVLTGQREPAWAWCTGADDLAPGVRGIPEPRGARLGAPALGAASLIIIPALLATRAGDRLGTGGGWYDRALGHRAPDATVAAVLSEEEIVATLPTEPWDLRVDVLVTEHGTHPTVAE
ncbi:MAG: 5-formyltetrahydrofolate cyclo-ligase [Propioniciclava sp.]